MNRPLGYFILRSMGAAVAGCLIPTAIFLLIAAFESGVDLNHSTVTTVLLGFVGGYITLVLIVAVIWMSHFWLFVILPASLFISPQNRFWHPAIAGPVGLLVAANYFAIMESFGANRKLSRVVSEDIGLILLAGCVGLTIGLVFSRLMRSAKKISKPLPEPVPRPIH